MIESKSKRQSSFDIGGKHIAPGTTQYLELPIARLPTGTWNALPLTVVHGSRPGKKLCLTAAIHGDEINGVEIIREVLTLVSPTEIAGTIIAVPIVNVFGFVQESRYLPDHRDLNRTFPGSSRGSLASRLAYLLLHKIVMKAEYLIDIHTSTGHRRNLPHIRADLKDPETMRLAKAFGSPVLLHARVRDKSLREAATEIAIKTLLYEGGEAHRFNSDAIVAGVKGTLGVLRKLHILPTQTHHSHSHHCFIAANSQWLRARQSGIFRLRTHLGEMVRKGDILGSIVNTQGDQQALIKAPISGIVISILQNPIIHQGDAIIHIAYGKIK